MATVTGTLIAAVVIALLALALDKAVESFARRYYRQGYEDACLTHRHQKRLSRRRIGGSIHSTGIRS